MSHYTVKPGPIPRTKRDIVTSYIARNKWLKWKSTEFKPFSLLLDVSDKTLKKILYELKDIDINGIKVRVKEEPFIQSDRSVKTRIWIWFDPPGGDYEYRLMAPILRMVLGDAVSLALRGELIEKWCERAQFPIVRATRELIRSILLGID